MRVSFSLVIAVIYFFFNSWFLPEGLLYTTILTPMFYYWLIKTQEKYVLTKFLIGLTPYFIAHLLIGVDYMIYLRSVVLLLSTYIFTYAIYQFVKTSGRIEYIFKKLLIANFFFTLLALVALLSPFAEIFWTNRPLTTEIGPVLRLQMLTYEPSYYSTLLVPIVIYYTIQTFLNKKKIINNGILLFMVYLPVLLSFSFGVISCLGIAFLVAIIYYFNQYIKSKAAFQSIVTLAALSIIVVIMLFLIFPNNLFIERFNDILAGKDISAKGRTIHSLYLAFQLVKMKSVYFGVGLGQIKVVGDEYIRTFYQYNESFPVIRIPSSIGETLGYFGLSGLLIRLGLQLYLFIRTKVYTNYYRMTVFVYIFIYQFTGSFLTNISEYVLWIIAFTPVFKQFNVTKESSPIKAAT